MNVKEKAKSIIRKYADDLEDSTGLDYNTTSYQIMEETIIEAMILFAKEMCELQKQECYDNAYIVRYYSTFWINPDTNKRYTIDELKEKYSYDNINVKDNGESNVYLIDKNSILNCKNVCDEI